MPASAPGLMLSDQHEGARQHGEQSTAHDQSRRNVGRQPRDSDGRQQEGQRERQQPRAGLKGAELEHDGEEERNDEEHAGLHQVLGEEHGEPTNELAVAQHHRPHQWFPDLSLPSVPPKEPGQKRRSRPPMMSQTTGETPKSDGPPGLARTNPTRPSAEPRTRSATVQRWTGKPRRHRTSNERWARHHGPCAARAGGPRRSAPRQQRPNATRHTSSRRHRPMVRRPRRPHWRRRSSRRQQAVARWQSCRPPGPRWRA